MTNVSWKCRKCKNHEKHYIRFFKFTPTKTILLVLVDIDTCASVGEGGNNVSILAETCFQID